MTWREERAEHSASAASSPSIPAPLTALIGRAAELEAVTHMLRRARLVTLTGPGGVGKTRLALELGRRQARQQADGVRLVDLAPVAAAEDVAAEAARILGIRGAPGDTMDVLRRYVADHKVLLVLDNCEHVLDACAELATTLLGACPNLRVLATSREPLGITGEAVWRLEPLPRHDAYRLFLTRARERRPELVVDDDTEAAILEICARFDDLPLGIELAAARVSVMSPEEIVTSLEVHLGEMGRPRRPAPPRHRSVWTAVEWSYKLLDPVERTAFRSLALFVGGFDVDAARVVAPGMSLDVLAHLVDKSLVTVIPMRQRRTRYRLLETVRQYALKQLAAADELAAARSRHLRHFSTAGAPAKDPWMPAEVVSFLEEWAADYGNIRAAAEWAAASEPCVGMRLVAQTKELFFMLGQADGSRLAELVLQRCSERNRHRVAVKIAAGHFAFLLGNTAAAHTHMTEAAEMSIELGERVLEGSAHWFLGLHQLFGGAPGKGRGHLARARGVQQETGDLLGEARTTAALGLTLLMDDDPARARELLESALAIGLAAGDPWSQGQANLYLGILADSSSSSRAASSFFRDAAECLRPYHDSTLLPVALVGQANVMARRDPATALKVVAAGWALRARNGGEFAPFFRAFAERARAAAAGGVGSDAQQLWKEGSRLDVDDALALAFGAARARAASPMGFSEREIEVVRLVTEGLSNQQIARGLHLSVRTVETHVRHALAKTGLVNRTQLATWAREHNV